MDLENFRTGGLMSALRSQKLRLPGSLISLLLLIIFSFVHFTYPGPDHQVETWIRVTLRAKGYFFFDNITDLGNITVILPAAFLLFLILLWKRKAAWATRLVITVFGGAAFGYLLKLIYSQSGNNFTSSRPETLDLGFPSGHTMMALLFYGFLTYFIVENIRDRKWKWATAVFGIVLAFLIGISRLMLSVHVPTDVLGGWAAGGIWLIVSSWLSSWLIQTIFPSIPNWFANRSSKE